MNLNNCCTNVLPPAGPAVLLQNPPSSERADKFCTHNTYQVNLSLPVAVNSAATTLESQPEISYSTFWTFPLILLVSNLHFSLLYLLRIEILYSLFLTIIRIRRFLAPRIWIQKWEIFVNRSEWGRNLLDLNQVYRWKLRLFMICIGFQFCSWAYVGSGTEPAWRIFFLMKIWRLFHTVLLTCASFCGICTYINKQGSFRLCWDTLQVCAWSFLRKSRLMPVKGPKMPPLQS